MNRVKRVVHATAAEVNGLSGKGVTAAVLDTGIALHPDLSGRIAGFADFVGGQKQPYDDSGHGTHVAGCLCGNGKCSNGLYAGIAPGCRLVVCKVLDERGDGNVAAMIEGIRYVLDTRRIYHTRILNISVGIGSIREAALEQELLSWIAKAWNAGLFVAVAAGNNGPAPNSVSAMGLQAHVVSVGCHDGRQTPGHKNACAAYSGRGPANGRVKNRIWWHREAALFPVMLGIGKSFLLGKSSVYGKERDLDGSSGSQRGSSTFVGKGAASDKRTGTGTAAIPCAGSGRKLGDAGLGNASCRQSVKGINFLFQKD